MNGIKIEAKGLQARLDELTDLEQKQLPYVVALALTQTGQQVKDRLELEMRTVFDRPTRWTLNSLRLFPATKDKPVARVWMKNEADKSAPATKWISPNIYGSGRNDKRVEVMLRSKGLMPEGKYVVPGAGAKLDRYGNISRGQVTKALSGVGGSTEQGYLSNATKSKRSLAKGNARRYFVMRRGREPIGIAERTGKGRDKVQIILAFVSRPSYRKTFNFFAIADRVAEDQLPIQFELALARAVATRR